MPHRLKIGEYYTPEALDEIFDFDYKGRAGIKKAASGDIVLFSNDKSRYIDICEGGIFDYEGQNTGPGDQKLIYGNKDLYDIYTNGNDKTIFLFVNYKYVGTVLINSEPYQKNGSWRFPLARVDGETCAQI